MFLMCANVIYKCIINKYLKLLGNIQNYNKVWCALVGGWLKGPMCLWDVYISHENVFCVNSERLDMYIIFPTKITNKKYKEV